MNIFIFRRDLRIHDNMMLMKSLKDGKTLPIFILTPKQLSDENKWKSNNAIQFMCESLIDLSNDIKKHGGKLYLFYGDYEQVIEKITKKLDITKIYFNADYTTYSKKRDDTIVKFCIKNNIDVETEYFVVSKKTTKTQNKTTETQNKTTETQNKTTETFEQKANENITPDIILNPVNAVMNGTGSPYVKFTPYYRAMISYNKKKKIPEPIMNNSKNYAHITDLKQLPIIDISELTKFYTLNKSIAVRGGRTNGMKILNELKNRKNINEYEKTRNQLHLSTTMLSAYNKFGCISIREVYHHIKNTVKNNKDLIKQLYWRDFYYNIAYNTIDHPNDVFKGHPMKLNYEKIEWENSNGYFHKWCEGKTGFPIIDAGMRELNTTGYMHNRCRLIVSNFLIKILMIDWRKGEQYFATKLTDYDPAQNNGNWQWSSGSGVDSQPYYRIFNPWAQGLKNDADCIYIKKWVTELKNISADRIHQWNIYYVEDLAKTGYIKPIVDYSVQKDKGLKIYKKLY